MNPKKTALVLVEFQNDFTTEVLANKIKELENDIIIYLLIKKLYL